MENQLFFTEKVQLRIKGENRYGKGAIRITDQNIYLDYKKVLGQMQNYVIPRENIETADILKSGPDATGYGPGWGANYKLWWYILDIKLKDGNAFQMYIGQPWNYPQKLNLQVTSDLKAIMQILNPQGSPEKFPWELE